MLPIGIGGNTLSSYNITDSLRFRRSANAYLSRTPASTGNRKTFTFSLWFKGKGYYTGNDHLIGVNTSSTSYARVYYGASGDNYLRVNQYVGGVNLDLITTQVLRDPSAWYHLVVAFDTTQATASNRIKMYLNGEQVTSFSTATYPSQNFDTLFNTTNEHRIGTLGATYNVGYEFDGYMAEVNFVDGQALTPSDFGEYNTDGVWSPKEYTGTYGTNGFYLPMKETTQATGFNTVLWTGNGGTQSITGVGFEPDLVWGKQRNGGGAHYLYDSVRGATKHLNSEYTYTEGTSTGLTSFDSDGFAIGSNSSMNGSGLTYVGWCWDAGSSTVSNTDGTITSSVRANPATGFSIVTYTGTGSSGTVGHGLGSTPDMIIVKRRNAVDSWFCYHSALTTDNYMLLNGTNAVQSLSGYWGTPSSTTFGAVYGGTNTSGGTYVAYCFSEVAGYSKFGSYTGNGSATPDAGNTVNCGFRPAFILFKNANDSRQWGIVDTTRSPSSPTNATLEPSTSNAENPYDDFNITDTGFSPATSDPGSNGSGHNIIYMAFADTRDYQWNFDASGNKNNWTPNNINSNASSETTYDLMSDVPTPVDEDTGNFATLNPLDADTSANLSISNANLTMSASNLYWSQARATIGVSSGKWYWEVDYISATSNKYFMNGIRDVNETLVTSSDYVGESSGGYAYYTHNGYKYNNATSSAYGSTATTGDTIGVALDMDAGTLTFYKNGTSQGVAYTGLSGTFAPAFSVNGNTGGTVVQAANFGQRPFKYTPPTGHLKLNTYNLPDSSITDGSDYFDTVTYTGDGGTSNSLTYNFSPDLVWSKSRSNAQSNVLYDSIRGGNNVILSNSTQAENTISPDAVSFDSNGHTWTHPYSASNFSGYTYVNWVWRGSDSTAVSNTDGTITSTVSANPTSGFSVVTYAGNNTAGSTIGHGLGAVPKMIIVKVRSAANAWQVRHASVPVTQTLQLENTTGAYTSGVWNNTSPTSSVFTVGTGQSINESGQTYVAYCFADVEGFSKFGSYTGNGSTDGPFIYTGFRPKFVMVKLTSASGENWYILDSVRNTFNVVNNFLEPNSSLAENEGAAPVTFYDFVSNGFKIRNNGSFVNTNGATYIYMAFAENPFKNSLAR